MRKYKKDKAVSPVIGVILMVAITVILAAIIGIFVLGVGSGVEDEARAGVSIDNKEDAVTIRVVTLNNADYVKIRLSGSNVAFDDDGGIKEGPIKINQTGSYVTIPWSSGRTNVRVSSSGVSYYDASGGSLSWESCPDSSTGGGQYVCELNDGIVDDGSGGLASDIPKGAEATVTVIAGRGDPSNPETETTIRIEDVTL